MIHQGLSDILNLKRLPLGELGFFYGGLSGKSKGDFEEGNRRFIPYMNVFSNSSVDVEDLGFVKVDEGERQNIVEYGDVLFTGSSETPDECGMSSVMLSETSKDNPIFLNSFCFGYRFNDITNIVPSFYKHLFRSDKIREEIIKTANGVTRFNISKKAFAKIVIPIPLFELQQLIADKLDSFLLLITKLDEEIELRKQQFEHYRDLLLDFNGKEGVEMITLENLAEIGTGGSNTQDELDNGKYPFYVRSQIVRWKDEYEFDETAIITSGDGVGVGKVLHYVEGKYALHQRAYRIHITSSDLSPKYFFYYMQKTFYNYIMLNAYAASVTSVRRPMLLNYPVPVIDKQEQERIVFILDTFTNLISKLEEERDLRQKQYEYYREKLLTFE